jgi:dCTP deaminase
VLLSDKGITDAIALGQVAVVPFDQSRLQPASIDVTLHPMIRVPDPLRQEVDVQWVPEDHTYLQEIDERDGYLLDPGEFILASTSERIVLDTWHAARAEGLSSLGRLGLAVHVTAGWIDPGFEGNVTLEIVNHASWSVRLRRGMRIAQFAFFRMDSRSMWPYYIKGHYMLQKGPVESRYRMKQ